MNAVSRSQAVIDFDAIRERASSFAELIAARREGIEEVLVEIESYSTIDDEMQRSTECLHGICEERDNFTGHVSAVSSFLPLNLPLYSLVLFGVIPHEMSTNGVYVRPPGVLRDVFSRLAKVLNLESCFPRLKLLDISRTDFVENYVKHSEVVIFTGTYKNAMAVKKEIPADRLFLFNGQGINPIVVAPDADVELAAEKTLAMKLFNSGQDCAAADMILVHDAVYDEFRARLCDKLSRIRVGQYRDASVQVGPLLDRSAIIDAGKLFMRHADRVVLGGTVDFKTGIVNPTVIECQESSYTEVFSPTFLLKRYKAEPDLREYFEHPTYRYHAMYASLFGSSSYLNEQTHTSVLHGKIVLDVEKGNNPYGGTAVGASFASFNKVVHPRPILVSREVRTYLEAKYAQPAIQS